MNTEAMRSVIIDTQQFYIDGKHAKNDLITVMKSKKNHPVDAKDFARVLSRTVKVLEAINKEIGSEQIVWALTEAAVIGERAQFTLRGYPKKGLEEAIKEQEAKCEVNNAQLPAKDR